MICVACGRAVRFRELWKDADGFQWFECSTCRSHVSESVLSDSDSRALYQEDYVAKLLQDEGGENEAFNNHLHNLQLFNLVGTQGTRMLDVGTGHGVSQRVFRAAGWDTLGFDVSSQGRPSGTVVAEAFSADLFEHTFDLVLCREVLEHTVAVKEFLHELARATTPQTGLCQITTPRPQSSGREYQCYNRYHVCLFSVEFLDLYLRNWFEVEAKVLWPLGQRYVLRPRELGGVPFRLSEE